MFTTKHGTPIEHRNLLRHFYGVCERLGLPQPRFHDLRHSTASLLLLRSIPPTTIIETLGHAVIHTTQYAHVAPLSLREAAATMDDLLGPRDTRMVVLMIVKIGKRARNDPTHRTTKAGCDPAQIPGGQGRDRTADLAISVVFGLSVLIRVSVYALVRRLL